MDYKDKLNKTIATNNSLLCIGLDADLSKLPKLLRTESNAVYNFNKAIIDATHDLVCSYKINIAFYSAYGVHGLESLIQTVSYIKGAYEEIPVILDAKRNDIDSTAVHYVKEIFDVIGADAVTVNPYLGFDSIKPFLERAEKGIIILCRTSNKGATDFQDLRIHPSSHPGVPMKIGTIGSYKKDSIASPGTGLYPASLQNDNLTIPLYIYVAKKVVQWNKVYKNCALVVGATWPEELKQIRENIADMFFLVPGVGAQGGNLEAICKNGLRPDKSGLLIHSSRGILYASEGRDFAQKAREKAEELRDQINKYRS